jgi:hypothetical protein
MSLPRRIVAAACLAAVAGGAPGCSREPAEPAETFTWCAQPIVFAPPPPTWYREATNSSGLLGVRFVMRRGLGECITVATYHWIAERDRRVAIERLIAERGALDRAGFLRGVSLARPRTDDPITDREAEASLAINAALDRAVADLFADYPAQVRSDLEEALRATSAYEITLADVLPRIRFRPDQMQEPDRWRVGYERDTTLAGHPAYASDGTFTAIDRQFFYREIYCVVDRCAFKAVYQGTPKNLQAFDRLVGSIAFPEAALDSTD